MGSPALIRNATFSACQRYRYVLERRWCVRPARRSTILFIGLNPSTADAAVDDPTIRRCMGFAQACSYDRLLVCNLFAYRTPYPQELLKSDDPVGEDNDAHLLQAARYSQLIIACWGRQGRLLSRDRAVHALLHRQLWCLGLNADHTPAHPLYLRKSAQPQRYRLLSQR